MKDGWERKRLGDVCDFDKAQGIHRGLPYVGLEHIESNTGRFIGSVEPLPVKSSTFRFSTEHVLYGRLRPYLNKAIAPDFEGHCSTEIFPIKPSPEVSRDYLLYWLLADETMERINGTCTGARMPRADMNEVLDFDFPVPPLAEQQRIVGVLDEAFAGLATAQAHAAQNLQNARALFESHLQSVFTHRGNGWIEKTLKDVCEEIFAGGDVPKDRLSEERTAKYSVPIYSNGEKNAGLYGFTDMARVTKPSITVSARGTLGFTAIRGEPFLPVVRLIVLIPDDKQIMLSFLYYAIVGMDFGNTGTSIPQLTVPNFKESKLHIPSLPEQKVIITQLDALAAEIQNLARLYEQKLAALAELKKSLLHQAFSGEL
jgi:type I restriction enzyme S subunit